MCACVRVCVHACVCGMGEGCTVQNGGVYCVVWEVEECGMGGGVYCAV